MLRLHPNVTYLVARGTAIVLLKCEDVDEGVRSLSRDGMRFSSLWVRSATKADVSLCSNGIPTMNNNRTEFRSQVFPARFDGKTSQKFRGLGTALPCGYESNGISFLWRTLSLSAVLIMLGSPVSYFCYDWSSPEADVPHPRASYLRAVYFRNAPAGSVPNHAHY